MRTTKDARIAKLEDTLADVATWLYHYLANNDNKTAGALLHEVNIVLHKGVNDAR